MPSRSLIPSSIAVHTAAVSRFEGKRPSRSINLRKAGKWLAASARSHHGNGTQHSFEADPRVFFCSFHGHPATLYPGTGYAEERGIGAGLGKTLNIPLHPGAGEAEFRTLYLEKFLPAALEFAPQFILISAGFDAHERDPLGPLALQAESFTWLTNQTVALARTCCAGRIVSTLEGGYDLDALGASATAHVTALLDC